MSTAKSTTTNPLLVAKPRSSTTTDEKPSYLNGDHVVRTPPDPNSKEPGFTSAPTTSALLHSYQTALGIPTSRNSFVESTLVSPSNSGIYNDIVKSEMHSRRSYKYYSFIISFSLVTQIILAAVLTAMGAAKVSHIAITTVSAVATIVAGNLALLKGQGLPDRARNDWMGWKGVRDFINEREAEIAAGMWTAKVDGSNSADGTAFGGGWEAVWTEVRVVEAMFKAVAQTVNNNRPDSYIYVPGSKAPGAASPNGGQDSESAGGAPRKSASAANKSL